MPKDDRAHVWAVDILICDFFLNEEMIGNYFSKKST